MPTNQIHASQLVAGDSIVWAEATPSRPQRSVLIRSAVKSWNDGPAVALTYDDGETATIPAGTLVNIEPRRSPEAATRRPVAPTTHGRPTITLALPGHGTTTVTAAALDSAIARYLPASPRALAELVAERAGIEELRNVRDVAALLVMLADFDHNTDDDPRRAY